MLSVLLFILKIIGIILLAILGLIVLLICIVLFVPIRYEGTGDFDKSKKSFNASVRVTWLAHIIRFKFTTHNEKMDFGLKVLWFDLMKGDKESKSEPEPEPESEPVVSKEDENISDHIVKEEKADDEETFKEDKTSGSDQKEDSSTDTKKAEKRPRVHKKPEKENKFTFDSLYDKLMKLADKAKKLIDMKDRILDFIKDKTHKRALILIRDKGIKLLKRLKPKKFLLEGDVGFEDPSITGYIMAAYSFFSPQIMNNIVVHPEFEGDVLEAKLYVKGKIMVFYFLAFAVSLLLKKEIRQTYKDVRKFKFSL